MSVKTQLCSIITMALIVSGCVVQQTLQQARYTEYQRDLAIEDGMDKTRRIDKISYRIRRAGIPLCGDRIMPIYGFRLFSPLQVDADFKDAYLRLTGGSNQIHIYGVTAGSPADVAGLKAGDAVLALNGEKLHSIYSVALKIIAPLNAGTPGETLTISRDGGNDREILIVSEPACGYGLHLRVDDAVNAYTEGDNVYITSGMVGFTENDTQLATAIAHQVAHNVMGHMDAKQATGLASAGDYSKDLESEADYVGLYLMALAGMEIDKTPAFWRRIAIAHPTANASNFDSTHPPTPERFIALENTVSEIALKISAGESLMPEMTVAPPS